MPPDIYFIDDDEGSLQSMIFLAESAGLTARGYASAAEFLEAAAALPLGCVVTDIRMPDIDGLELMARLRGLELGHRIVAITGHGDLQLAEDARLAGADAFLEKPFLAGDLLAAILGE